MPLKQIFATVKSTIDRDEWTSDLREARRSLVYPSWSIYSLPRGKIELAIDQACSYYISTLLHQLNRGEGKPFTVIPVLCCIQLYLWFYVISSLLYAVSIRMKNNNESAISLLFVSLYIIIDWNFISYTFTFSSSLLSSINFVPSSDRYKLQNRFRVFLFCFCDYSIKPIKQCFYNVFITLW
jgi:hypothetical protein